MIDKHFNTNLAGRPYQAHATAEGITVQGPMLNIRGARLPNIQKQITAWLRDEGYPVNWDGRRGVRIDNSTQVFVPYSPYHAQQMLQVILKLHMETLPEGKALVAAANTISRQHYAAERLGIKVPFSEQYEIIRGLGADWEALIIREAAGLQFPFEHILDSYWARNCPLPYTDYQYRSIAITLQESDLYWMRRKVQATLQRLDQLEIGDQI